MIFLKKKKILVEKTLRRVAAIIKRVSHLLAWRLLRVPSDTPHLLS